MGKAYGTPIPQTTDGPQLRSAESQAEARQVDGFEYLWRIEAVSYSQCVDPDADRYESTPPRLELFFVSVKRWTPHGATLWEGRWTDLRADRKQYASRTVADALEQFRRRRVAQIHILQAQLARAERELALTQPHPLTTGPFPA